MLECYLQAAGIIVWSRSKSCILRLSSPERARLQELQDSILASESSNQTCTVAPAPLGSSSPSKENLVLYVPEVEEIRISPVIARKGYLNVLEHKTNGWKKRWVVRTRRSLLIRVTFTRYVGDNAITLNNIVTRRRCEDRTF